MILFWVFAGFPLPILIAEQDAGIDQKDFIRVVVRGDKIEFFSLLGELHGIFQAGLCIIHVVCDVGLPAGKGKDVIKMMMSGLSTPWQLPDFQLTEYILGNGVPSRIYRADRSHNVVCHSYHLNSKDDCNSTEKDTENLPFAKKYRYFKIYGPNNQCQQRARKKNPPVA